MKLKAYLFAEGANIGNYLELFEARLVKTTDMEERELLSTQIRIGQAIKTARAKTAAAKLPVVATSDINACIGLIN